MASPLRILTIGSKKIRADKVAYIFDYTNERRVYFEGGFVVTTDSIATLQTEIPELMTLTYINGGNIYVNAVGITAVQTTSDSTLITMNTVGAINVTESVSDVEIAINLKLATGGGDISGTIGISQIAFGGGVDSIIGSSAFTYSSVESIPTSKGYRLTPQSANTATASAANNIWLDEDTGHLKRGDIDLESSVIINVTNDSVAEGSSYTIPVGAPLYARGDASGENRLDVGIADAADPNKMPCIGIAMVEIGASANGYAMLTGMLSQSLSGFTGATSGASVYVKPSISVQSAYTAGEVLTLTRPTSSAHTVQAVGIIGETSGTEISDLIVTAANGGEDVPNQFSITGSITAASFVTNGGTATQYVRGNGSATSLDIVDDTTPQLGGSLDTQGNSITGNYATDGRRAIVIENGTTRTLSIDDSGDYIIATSTGATTITIPASATTNFTTGTEIEIAQKGTGAVTVSAASSDVTVNGTAGGTFTLPNQWGAAFLKKIDDDEWLVVQKGLSEVTDWLSGLIPTLGDKDYELTINIPEGITITETTTKCASGTATATFKINTTALGGTANSVSSTEQSQSHSSSNTMSSGDDLVLTISSNSSCVDMSFTIKYTKTL